MAQTVKCLPAIQETQVRSLGQEDHLEKARATHSSTLAWKIPWTAEPGSPWGRKESNTTEQLPPSLHPLQYSCSSPVAQVVKNLPAMQET